MIAASSLTVVGKPDRSLAKLVVLLLPIAGVGASGLSLGTALAVISLPIIIPAVRRYSSAWSLIALFTAALASGPALVYLSVSNPLRSLDLASGTRVTFLIGQAVLTFAALLWARSLMSSRLVAVLYAGGVLIQAFLLPEVWKDNPWKHALAWPTTVLVLCLVARRSHRASFVALAALATMSLITESRSFFGLCVVSIVITVALNRSDLTTGLRQGSKPVVVIALATVGLLFLGQWMAANGHLGRAIQARSQLQSRDGLPAVVVARPEASAAIALLRQRPIGFGPGVVPSLEDVRLAKSGLAQIGAATTGEYVDEYLFGDRIELHSIIFNMWATFGLAGLVAALAATRGLVRALAPRITGPSPVLHVFVIVVSLWNLAFSPNSALPSLMFTLALVAPGGPIIRRRSRELSRSRG